MRRPAHPFAPALNAALLAAALVLDMLHFGVLARCGFPPGPLAVGAWLACIALAMPLRIALLHESLHGRLLPGRWNEAAGRWLAIGAGVAWDVLRVGHATHHHWSRHPLDRPDVARPGASAIASRLRHLAALLGGVYLVEWLASWVQWLPRTLRERTVLKAFAGDAEPLPALRALVLANVRDGRRVRSARLDVLAGFLLWLAALVAWGEQWWVFVVAAAVRAIVVSVLDNAAHHGTPARLHAPARDMALPRGVRWWLLNGHLHETHHRFPAAPWWDLPRLHRAAGGPVQGTYAAAVLRQFKGPMPSVTPASPS